VDLDDPALRSLDDAVEPDFRQAFDYERDVFRCLDQVENNRQRLLLGSGVVTGPSRYQACDESAEQGSAASARVVHELEEAEVERQLVL